MYQEYLTPQKRKEIYLKLAEETDKPFGYSYDGTQQYFTCWKLQDILEKHYKSNLSGFTYNEEKVLTAFPEFEVALTVFESMGKTIKHSTVLPQSERRNALLHAASLCIEDTTPAKGDFNGICYRTACNNTHATFYNYSTRKFYCPQCAELINEANKEDAQCLYGHELCLEQDREVIQ